MAIQTCPTALVRTPANRVWHLLATPSELGLIRRSADYLARLKRTAEKMSGN